MKKYTGCNGHRLLLLLLCLSTLTSCVPKKGDTVDASAESTATVYKQAEIDHDAPRIVTETTSEYVLETVDKEAEMENMEQYIVVEETSTESAAEKSGN